MNEPRSDADLVLRLGLELALLGNLGRGLKADELARLGLFLARRGARLRRLQRSLDEIVAEAAEEERATAARERFQPVVASILAGVAGFREPDHIIQQGDDH